MTTIYEKKYNYGQVKAICEVFKYNDILQLDYEDIINIALGYYDEWKQLAKNYGKGKPVYNKIGNEVEFINEEEYAYEQAYFDRRVSEDYLK